MYKRLAGNGNMYFMYVGELLQAMFRIYELTQLILYTLFMDCAAQEIDKTFCYT